MATKPLDPQGLIEGLEWGTRRQFLRFANQLFRETSLRLEVRSGRRTCKEQNQIYARGRTTGGGIQTHARGCQSWHTIGRAVDAYVITPAGRRSTNQADYEKAGRLWEAEFGGVWGGDFKGFGPGGDAGHFEYHPGLKIADVCPDPSQCEASVAVWGRSDRPIPVALVAAAGALLGLGGAWIYWRMR